MSEAEAEMLARETYKYLVPRGIPTSEAEILEQAALLELAIREAEGHRPRP